jgi:exosortase H (IPTLxxWG-CTERM-specific)
LLCSWEAQRWGLSPPCTEGVYLRSLPIPPAASVHIPGVVLNRKPLGFFLIFACCFLVGVAVLLAPPVQTADREFSRGLVQIAYGVIRICGGKALVEGAILFAPSRHFGVEMRDGCNAVNVTLLLWPAMLAFPASWRSKAGGLLAGTLVIQGANILRFISLFYIGQYSATWFDFAHSYLWESLLILDTMVVFWVWVSRVSRRGTLAHAVR